MSAQRLRNFMFLRYEEIVLTIAAVHLAFGYFASLFIWVCFASTISYIANDDLGKMWNEATEAVSQNLHGETDENHRMTG
jgi:hypothetical protein